MFAGNNQAMEGVTSIGAVQDMVQRLVRVAEADRLEVPLCVRNSDVHMQAFQVEDFVLPEGSCMVVVASPTPRRPTSCLSILPLNFDLPGTSETGADAPLSSQKEALWVCSVRNRCCVCQRIVIVCARAGSWHRSHYFVPPLARSFPALEWVSSLRLVFDQP